MTGIDQRRAEAPLAIEERRDGDLCTVELAGELDLSNAERFRGRLDAVRASGVARVVVDLRRLEFIDSSGLRILLRADQATGDGAAAISFVPAKGQVQRVMQVAGIDDELTFVE
jgi:anti-sigma B factor antagonist